MRAVVAVLAAVLLWPAAATADVVATLDGAELRIRTTERGALCPRLTVAGEGTAEAQCERAPRFASTVRTLETGGYAALVLAPSVATVDAAGAQVPTVEAAGRAVRVVLLRVDAPDTLIRGFDAGGSPVAAALASGPERTGGPVLFTSPEATIRVYRGLELEPTPLRIDRTIATTCLVRETETFLTGGTTCAFDTRRRVADAEVVPLCRPDRGLLQALLPTGAAQVRIVLGPGAVRTVPAVPVPGDLGTGAVLAYRLPPGVAVRSFAVLGADGTVLQRVRVAAPPTGGDCDVTGRLTGAGRAGARPELPVPIAEPTPLAVPGVRLGDGTLDTLCLQVGDERRATCAAAPVGEDAGTLRRVGRIAAGVVGREVTTVVLRLDDGRLLRVAATDPAGYAGPYAGVVRLATTRLPPGARLRGATTIAADGSVLGRLGVDDPADEQLSRRPVGPGLAVDTIRYRGSVVARCLAARGLPRLLRGTCLLQGFPEDATVATVRCSPRRALLVSVLPRGTTGVRVRLAGRAPLKPPVRRIAGFGSVLAVALPRRATLLGVRRLGALRGRRGTQPPERDVTIRLPPAAEQCGYDAIA